MAFETEVYDQLHGEGYPEYKDHLRSLYQGYGGREQRLSTYVSSTSSPVTKQYYFQLALMGYPANAQQISMDLEIPADRVMDNVLVRIYREVQEQFTFRLSPYGPQTIEHVVHYEVLVRLRQRLLGAVRVSVPEEYEGVAEGNFSMASCNNLIFKRYLQGVLEKNTMIVVSPARPDEALLRMGGPWTFGADPSRADGYVSKLIGRAPSEKGSQLQDVAQRSPLSAQDVATRRPTAAREVFEGATELDL
jgi:hypothetical protein